MKNTKIDSNQETNNINLENKEQSTDSISTEDEKIPVNALTISEPLAKMGNILLWIGGAIIIFIKDEWLQLRAADTKYFAGILIMIAAKAEGKEIEASTGIIPEQNPAKVAGTIISQTGAAILISVLEREIKRTKTTANSPVVAPFIGGVGAIQ